MKNKRIKNENVSFTDSDDQSPNIRLVVNNEGGLSVSDFSSFSDSTVTSPRVKTDGLMRLYSKGRRIRELKGALPTEKDMKNAKMKIFQLSEEGELLPKLIRGAFRHQINLVGNQLRLIRQDIGKRENMNLTEHRALIKMISKKWDALNAKIIMTENYYN